MNRSEVGSPPVAHISFERIVRNEECLMEFTNHHFSREERQIAAIQPGEGEASSTLRNTTELVT